MSKICIISRIRKTRDVLHKSLVQLSCPSVEEILIRFDTDDESGQCLYHQNIKKSRVLVVLRGDQELVWKLPWWDDIGLLKRFQVQVFGDHGSEAKIVLKTITKCKFGAPRRVDFHSDRIPTSCWSSSSFGSLTFGLGGNNKPQLRLTVNYQCLQLPKSSPHNSWANVNSCQQSA